MSSQNTPKTGSGELQSGSHQYLTFMLGEEEYGVEILCVQGIQGWESATPIPNSPDYVLGVTNLRGAVVPIIDLRRRFGLQERGFSPTTVVIVVKAQGVTQNRVVGMVVDGVSDVHSVDEEEVQPSPDFGARVDTSFIRGLSTVDKKMLILLDIDKLLNDAVEADFSLATQPSLQGPPREPADA